MGNASQARLLTDSGALNAVLTAAIEGLTVAIEKADTAVERKLQALTQVPSSRHPILT